MNGASPPLPWPRDGISSKRVVSPTINTLSLNVAAPEKSMIRYSLRTASNDSKFRKQSTTYVGAKNSQSTLHARNLRCSTAGHTTFMSSGVCVHTRSRPLVARGLLNQTRQTVILFTSIKNYISCCYLVWAGRFLFPVHSSGGYFVYIRSCLSLTCDFVTGTSDESCLCYDPLPVCDTAAISSLYIS